MARGKWLGRWFKMYDNFDDPKFWTSKVNNDELGAWLRLLAIASQSNPKGSVQPLPGLKMTTEQINDMIKTGENYLKKWEKQGSIRTDNGIIYIVNWSIYQSEQDRKESYKDPLNRPPKQTFKQTRKDVDVDVELDLEENKESKPLTAKELPSVFNAFKFFFDQYLEKRGVKYIATDSKKEAGIITNLCKKVGESEFKRAIENMFQTKDAFILKQGLSVYTLNSKINLWLEKPIPAADPNADNRYFVEKGGKYYVMNNETDNFSYPHAYWLERIEEFEKINKKKADVRHE